MSVHGRYKKSPPLYLLSPNGRTCKDEGISDIFGYTSALPLCLPEKFRPLIRRPVPLRRKA